MKKAVLGVSLIAAVVVIWLLGRPAYQRHREARAIEHARRFLAAGDFRNANLSARRALAVNPRNLEACQLMAQLAEIAGVPQVLDWRRRVVEIAPTLENKLKFAATALMVERPPCALASQALDEVGPTATNSVAYHLVAAKLAIKLNRISDAEGHFLAAGRLEPTNQLHQLNFAVVRLRSTNEVLAAEARATLEGLTANTNLSRIALQWLVNDCLTRKDFRTAEDFSNRLMAEPQAGLEDRLQHLTILQQAARPELTTYLASVQAQAATNPGAAQVVAKWMISHNLAASAMAWLTNCPAKVQEEQPFPLALVDCYLALKDWGGLETWLVGQKWGDMEFVRLAALSRAEEQQHNDPAADAHWRLAVRQASGHLGPLTSLLSMATGWGRNKASEDLLWQINERFPRERWTLRELEHFYGVTGNTRGLNKLYGVVSARDARDLVTKNNFASTSLLLGTSLTKANEAAKEVYTAGPNEPIFVSTYAWSLHLQGQTRSGLAALEKLEPTKLESSDVALYYGLLLAADNQSVKAAKYFALVNRKALLPEEKELLATAEKDGVRGN